MKRLNLITPIVCIVVAVAASTGISWWMIDQRLDHEADTVFSSQPVNQGEREVVSLSRQDLISTFSAQGTVVTVDEADSFAIHALVTDYEVAYQLIDPPESVRAEISGGPSGFDCSWDGLVETEQGLVMTCSIPDDIRVVSGLQARMVLRLGDIHEVSALPVSAVFGESQAGEVVVVRADGSLERRAVQLGETDGASIEILEGVEQDESVLLYPTATDLANANAVP